jgi:multidrug transporter EmrE-like cation transporter
MFPLILPSIIAIVAGVLIFVYPRLLSQIVALYLIIVGILGLIPLFF